MKRLLCAAGTLFALVAFSAVSQADLVRYDQIVPFRFNRAATPPVGQFCVGGGASDSFVVIHAGSRTDTTEAFTLPGYARDQFATTLDSTEFIGICFSQVSGGGSATQVTAASGTTTFALQHDDGGGNWLAFPTFTTVTMTATGTGNYCRDLVPLLPADPRPFLTSKWRAIIVSAGSGEWQFHVTYWGIGNPVNAIH